jgi:hypothetical protein
VATGNGSAVSPTDPYDGSDSVVELSPALRLEQRFSPVRWRRDNATDTDLGSTSPALVGGLVVIAGKGSEVYLLRGGRLGGIGGDLAALDFCPGSKPTGGDAVFGTTVYVGCESGLVALAVHASPPALAVRWQTSTGAGGPPIVAGGLVWTIDQHGVLWGLDPGSGGAVVHEPLGGVANHFPTPAVGDGLLLAAGVDQVHAFTGPAGLPPAP